MLFFNNGDFGTSHYFGHKFYVWYQNEVIQMRYKIRIWGQYPLKIAFETSPSPPQSKTIMTMFVEISSTQNDAEGVGLNLVWNIDYVVSRKAIKVSRWLRNYL